MDQMAQKYFILFKELIGILILHKKIINFISLYYEIPKLK